MNKTKNKLNFTMSLNRVGEKEEFLSVPWNYTDYNRDTTLVHPFWANTSLVPPNYHIVTGVIMCIALILSILGNTMVLLVICKYKRMHSSANILVGNLALADLLMSSLDVGFVAISSFHGEWIFGNFGCKAYAYTVSMVSILSISTLTLIAIDRYVVIVKCWLNYRRSRKKRAVLFLSIAWFYSTFWALCPLLGWGAFMLEGYGTSCTFDYLTRSLNNTSFVLCLNIFAFFVPVSIIGVCYINIIRALCRHKKDMKNMLHILGPDPRIPKGKKLNVELKTARALAIAIVLFCVCWAPYGIMSLIAQFGDTSLITRYSTGIPGIAAKCMTCLNPFLYAISNPLFLTKIKEIVCCRRKFSQRRRPISSLSSPSIDVQSNNFNRNQTEQL